MASGNAEIVSMKFLILESFTRHLRSRWFLFGAAWVAGFVLLAARSPNCVLDPFLYTEDGRDYAPLLLSKSFFGALRDSRQDYGVLGNVAIAQGGVWLWQIFEGQDFTRLPYWMAVVTNTFLAGVLALPWLLLRDAKVPALLLLWICSVFFPMGATDFEVVGRPSNTGYAFMYLAFLLVVFRHGLRERWLYVLPVDLGLAASVWTNPIVFALFPALLLRFWNRRRIGLVNILRLPSFQSLILLSVLCLPVALTVLKSGKRHGSEGAPPLTIQNAVEIGLARNILYPIVHPFYLSLRTRWTLAIAAAVAVSLLLFGTRRRAFLYVLGVYILLVSSAAYLYMRPQLRPAESYKYTIPNNYYYGHNLIALFVLCMLLEDFVRQGKRPALRLIVPLAFLGLYFSDLHKQATLGKSPHPALMGRGDFRYAIVAAEDQKRFCDEHGQPAAEGAYVRCRIYPRYNFSMVLDRRLVPPLTSPPAVVAGQTTPGIRR